MSSISQPNLLRFNPIATQYGKSYTPSKKQSLQFSGTLNPLNKKGAFEFNKVLIGFFKGVSESFLLGFLAQDVVSMWFPRIFTSLATGREKPDSSKKDPKSSNQNVFQRAWQKVSKFFSSFSEFVRSLNWENFAEETRREVCTGPGLLFIPSVLYLLNRNFDNPSVELSNKSLKQLGEGFSAHLASLPDSQMLNKKAYETEVSRYLNAIFCDPGLDTETKKQLGHITNQYSKLLLKPKQNNGLNGLFRDFIGFFQRQEKLPLEDELNQSLKELLSGFNQKHRAEPYKSLSGDFQFSDEAPVVNQNKTWVNYRARITDSKPELKDVSELGQEIHRMRGYFGSVWNNVKSDVHGARLIDLKEQAAYAAKKITVKKSLLTFLACAMTTTFLTRMAFWAQKGNSYPGTRLLRESKAQNNKTGSPKPQTEQLLKSVATPDDLKMLQKPLQPIKIPQVSTAIAPKGLTPTPVKPVPALPVITGNLSPFSSYPQAYAYPGISTVTQASVQSPFNIQAIPNFETKTRGVK